MLKAILSNELNCQEQIVSEDGTHLNAKVLHFGSEVRRDYRLNHFGYSLTPCPLFTERAEL